MGMLTIKYPESFTLPVESLVISYLGGDNSDTHCILSLGVGENKESTDAIEFLQTEELTNAGIAVHPYGAIIYKMVFDGEPDEYFLSLKYKGKTYTSTTKFSTGIVYAPGEDSFIFNIVSE